MKNKIIALLVLFTVILFSSAQAQTTAHKLRRVRTHSCLMENHLW